jgi:hypothetical protein
MENIFTLKSETIILNNAGSKALITQTMLLISALVLPSVCHYLALPAAKFLPMHWPVLFAGLAYGYRSGFVLGLLAPSVSFLLGGMPPADILPIMICELAAYGLIAGFCREKLKLGFFFSCFFALLCGKAVYITSGFLFGAGTNFSFLQTGILAVSAQLLLLPVLASKWTGWK